MEPLKDLPKALESQLELASTLQVWLEENRVWEGHRCLFCESALLDLENYTVQLRATAPGQASARLPALAQAARAAEAFAENATRQGVALQELVEGLSNVSGHLEASSHTWRATADWMPWAVGLWSSLVVVAALVAAAAACWVASQPSRLETLGCVSNSQALDHQAIERSISKVAWGEDTAPREPREPRVDVIRIAMASWQSSGLMCVAVLVATTLTMMLALILKDLSAVSPQRLLQSQLLELDVDVTESALSSCFEGESFSWPHLNEDVASPPEAPWPLASATATLAALRARGPQELHGRYFRHEDATGLLPLALSTSSASREPQAEEPPGMYGYAFELNRLMLDDPPWSFESLAAPSAACAASTQCRNITTVEPSDAVASRDLGGAVAVELFRVARQKERVWHSLTEENVSIHEKLPTDLAALHQEDLLLAGFLEASEELLNLYRLWAEPVEHSQSLMRSDCSWLLLEKERLLAAAGGASELLVMSAIMASLQVVCLALLTRRAFRIYWWAQIQLDGADDRTINQSIVPTNILENIS